MSKKILAILMASCTLLSMAACKSKSVPSSVSTAATTAASETTILTTEETSAEETTTAEETTKEETSESKTTKASETTKKTAKSNSKAIGKTTVTNAYSRNFKIKKDKYTTRYPKVTIKGVNTSAINKEIADKFGPIAKKNSSVVRYSYYIGKNYVSIFIKVILDTGKEGSNYYVYNVSRVTGKKLSRAEMLKIFNMKDSAFKSKVTTGIKKWWNTNVPNYKKNKKDKAMYDKALAAKSLNSAIPFVNSKGKKCFLIRQMKAPTQMGLNDFYAAI